MLGAHTSRTGMSQLSKTSKANPRLAMIKLMEDFPDASKDEIIIKFKTLIRHDDELQDAIADYSATNLYTYADNEAKQRSVAFRAAKAATQAEHEEKAKVFQAEFVRRIQVLAFKMPNGKELGDCTGAEMDTFGDEWKAIAKRVGPENKVRSRLSEDEVRALAPSAK